MLITALVGAICSLGIAFYARFLVALNRESGPRRIGYWIRLRSRSGTVVVTKLENADEDLPRAA